MRVRETLSFAVSASFVFAACGKEEKKETVYDYYIEEGEFNGSDTDADPNGGSADATKKNDKRFHFVSQAAAATASGVVKVELAFTDVDPAATWSVYFAKTATATNGTAIAIDLPVSQTSVDWDTTDVEAGTYYLYAVLTSGSSSGRSNAAAAVTIAAAGADDGGEEGAGDANKKPTLALDFPAGENVLVAGMPQAIKYTAADADGDELKFKLEYSADGGTTWMQIAADVTDTTYDWDVAGLPQGITYKVRVTADDGQGGTAQAQSPKAFGVATTPMTFAAGFGAMLTQRCGNCHAMGGPNQGVFRSDNFALATIGVSDKMNNIKGRIEAGTMPPAGALGAADKAILTMWIWAGGD